MMTRNDQRPARIPTEAERRWHLAVVQARILGEWSDDDWSMLAECCDDRPHVLPKDGECACSEHPNSYLHPFGTQPWPEP